MDMRKALKTNPWTKRGFSLVELLVASALFTIVVAVTAGSFITVLDASRQSRELNKLMLAVDFAMEDMSRTIRTGKDFTITPGGVIPRDEGFNIIFLDENGDEIGYTYSYSAPDGINRVMKRVGGRWLHLTPAGIRITRLNFTSDLVSNGSSSNQPRIRINLIGEIEETGEEFHLQTSVTQRELNF